MSVTVYYVFIALRLLPEIITVLKFRTKKLLKKNFLSPSLIFLPNFFSYSRIIGRKNLYFFEK